MAAPENLTAIGDSLAASEKLFAERTDITKLREAVNSLGNARNPDQRNFEVEWKFAKYSYFLGKAEPVEKDAIVAFEKGRDAGKIASRVDPNKPDGHFWYGANLGELGRISPITVGLKSIDDIREAMEAVIKIQPDYQGASSYDALGQLEMKTQLRGGTLEKAVEYFEKGITLSGDNANLRLHLAEAYLALNKDTEARKQLDTLFATKANPEYVNEHRVALEQGKKLLEKL
ncbi:MAG TPA: tetratricopeptide repeat protein [Pyrinomonadaceae bacterium]|nr:tetratricopeptide repeat protein [Pyrinomonadaceae bacterium]